MHVSAAFQQVSSILKWVDQKDIALAVIVAHLSFTGSTLRKTVLFQVTAESILDDQSSVHAAIRL